MKIGFVGLGIMGIRMAANLQKKGHELELVIHNRSRQKAGALIANGAKWAATPADAAKEVKVIITMLAKPDVKVLSEKKTIEIKIKNKCCMVVASLRALSHLILT